MAARYYPRRKPEHELPVRIVTIIGKGLWNLVTLPFQGLRRGSLDRDYYREHWQVIVGIGAQDSVIHWRQAIIQADSLVDKAMRDLLFPGTTFGDRLTNSEHRFDPKVYNKLWQAHKLRNKIGHENDLSIAKQDVETALDGFVQALYQLGAL